MHTFKSEEKIRELYCKQDSRDYQGDLRYLIDDIHYYLLSQNRTDVTFDIAEYEGKLIELRGCYCEWDRITLVILSIRDVIALLEFERVKQMRIKRLLTKDCHEIRNPTNAIISISHLDFSKMMVEYLH